MTLATSEMYFDDMELMQLEFCLKQTEDKMMMGGEIRRHASITQKIKEEMEDRKNKNKSYTTVYLNQREIAAAYADCTTRRIRFNDTPLFDELFGGSLTFSKSSSNKQNHGNSFTHRYSTR